LFAKLVLLHTNVLQAKTVETRFKSAPHVTRFTKRKFVGLRQSTDVYITTPLWPSLMTEFDYTFPALSCWRAMRGLA